MTNCLLLLAALLLQDSGLGMVVNANESVCYGFSKNYIIDCRYSLNRKCNYAMRHAGLSCYPPDMSLMLSFSFPQSLPPSFCTCPSINEAIFLSPTLQNLLPVSNSERPGMLLRSLWGVNTSAAESTSSKGLLSSFLSFRDLFQTCLHSHTLFWLFTHMVTCFKKSQCLFFALWPIPAPTSLNKHLRLHITVHRALFSLLQMSSIMEYKCFKQLNNWGTAPCRMWLNIQSKRSTMFQPNSL